MTASSILSAGMFTRCLKMNLKRLSTSAEVFISPNYYFLLIIFIRSDYNLILHSKDLTRKIQPKTSLLLKEGEISISTLYTALINITKQ